MAHAMESRHHVRQIVVPQENLRMNGTGQIGMG